MLSTHIYHQLPLTCFGICYGTYRETVVLLTQTAYAFCNVVAYIVLQIVQYTLLFF